MMRQLQLLPAGCQPWNPNMLDGTESKFAYCSTLAVYIYERLPGSQEYKLSSINAEHDKAISSISWNKKRTNLVATSGGDSKIIVWDVVKQKAIAKLRYLKQDPRCIDWVNSDDGAYLTYIGSSGYLEEWNISNGKVNVLKNIACISGTRVSVFRWHHSKPETVAFGFEDGTVSVFCRERGLFKKTKVKFDEESIEGDFVQLLSWDPLSEDYILVANLLTGVRMVDTVSGSVVTTFCLPSKAVTTVTFSWIHSAPGMFLTGDRENGVLRLWTVGQETPVGSFRIKQMGFNGIHVINSTAVRLSYDENYLYGSHRRKRSQSQSIATPVPPANVVCTFRDGGVGLYDLQRRKWVVLKDQGHIETIFDCKFKADNPKILATASFDGTVKIWSTSDLSPVKSSVGNEGVIYSISWAPQDLDCIVCGTRRKGVFVWDYKKGRVIKRFAEHGTNCVFSVAWSKKDSHKIASASEDKTCVVRQLNGENIRRMDHPAAVYGCDWSNNDKDKLATGCDDGVVRVWYVNSYVKCLFALEGHEKKVFHVRWHPLIENVLCSGSDDCTVRVWNTASKSPCVAVLNGHTDKVRGLSWNHEVPYLLVSGSWDSTIRLWDVRELEQKCLDVIDDHGADVYGLDSHPSSPFLLASSSRDSTVRLWSLAPYVSMLFAKALAGHRFDLILATANEVMVSSDMKLSGRMSMQISNELSSRPDSTVLKLRWLSEFFVGNPALENLWDVAFFGQGAKETSLSPDYKKGIIHRDHLIKYTAAEALEIEMATSAKSASGNRQQEMLLENAASSHLKIGNLRKHCEILKQLGRWETALSLAAGVSMKYWRSLAEEYARLLKKSGDSEYLPYRVAIGDGKKCVEDLLQNAEYKDALLLAQSACEGRISAPVVDRSDTVKSTQLENGTTIDPELEILRDKCFEKLSLFEFNSGDPLRSATYLLSKNDRSGAIDTLLRGNELIIALCLGKALKISDESTRQAALLYSRKLEGKGNYYFAIEMVHAFLQCNVTDDNWTPVHASCARFIGDESHRVNLHQYAGLPPPDRFSELGETYLASGNTVKAIQCFLLSTQRLKALEVGLKYLKKEISRRDWCLDDEQIVQALNIFTISSVILTEREQRHARNQLLAISALIGCLKALKHGFLTVVTPLLEHAVAMTERVEMAVGESQDFPLTSKDLSSYLRSWVEYISKRTITDKAETIKSKHLNEVRIFQLANVKSISRKETVAVGSPLPSHTSSIMSTLTKQQIHGPKFYLDDGITMIALDEAVMWARVNEFSPTGSGRRIIPF